MNREMLIKLCEEGILLTNEVLTNKEVQKLKENGAHKMSDIVSMTMAAKTLFIEARIALAEDKGMCASNSVEHLYPALSLLRIVDRELSMNYKIYLNMRAAMYFYLIEYFKETYFNKTYFCQEEDAQSQINEIEGVSDCDCNHCEKDDCDDCDGCNCDCDETFEKPSNCNYREDDDDCRECGGECDGDCFDCDCPDCEKDSHDDCDCDDCDCDDCDCDDCDCDDCDCDDCDCNNTYKIVMDMAKLLTKEELKEIVNEITKE